MQSSSQVEGRLGRDYQEVEWLRGTGTQYCETDINPKALTTNVTVIKGDVTLLTVEDSKFSIMGRWNDSKGLCYYGVYTQVANNENWFYFRYGVLGSNFNRDYLTRFGSAPLNLHYELNFHDAVLNDYTYQKTFTLLGETNSIMYIGAYKDNSLNLVIHNENANYKTFTIYNKDTLLATYVPCYRKTDRKTGFCKIDASTGTVTFFPNLGEGDEWIIGAKV